MIFFCSKKQGWGAVAALQELHGDDYNITLISENNYFLFTPLLPSATVVSIPLFFFPKKKVENII